MTCFESVYRTERNTVKIKIDCLEALFGVDWHIGGRNPPENQCSFVDYGEITVFGVLA